MLLRLIVYSSTLIELGRSLSEIWLSVDNSSQEELWIFLTHPEDSIASSLNGNSCALFQLSGDSPQTMFHPRRSAYFDIILVWIFLNQASSGAITCVFDSSSVHRLVDVDM